jgi:hypothetical protein
MECNTLQAMAHTLTPVQRMVVSHDGTLQDLLSAYFGYQVYVAVYNQVESHGNIIRNSGLYVDGSPSGTDVCLATSVIPTSSTILQNVEFVDQIRQCEHGIGFILNELGIKTRREILDVRTNVDMFRRVYRIFDDESEIDIIITEVFPAYLYKNKSTVVSVNK